MVSTHREGASRAVLTKDLHGNNLHASADYIANAQDIGSLGIAVASSGFTISGTYVELTTGLDRRVVTIYNSGAQMLFVGPSGNGVANMYPVPTGGQVAFNATSGVRIWGVTEGTATNVRILELA